MDLIITILGVLLVGVIIFGGVYVRSDERKHWNKGICSKCGEPWELYDVDSQGEECIHVKIVMVVI